MDVKIREFLDSVGSFFTGGDHIPWSDRDIIAGCEREVTESGTTETKNEGLMRLSWALVHSRHSEDVNRGTIHLEARLGGSSSPLQTREKLYLLSVGFYRNGDYSRSRHLLEQCLKIAPDWRQPQTRKKVVEDQIAKVKISYF
ncbi:mitochondrial fission 1 protein A-like [Zingiber officinale]|uniref:mitochondrial fission 1 protein A-like n=1 Tax=Zingiber officinale TaxID=94328 RepID=UPI001C4B9090|nr:mitochondrial fission 1 protein A-like [Zingiber officinale]